MKQFNSTGAFGYCEGHHKLLFLTRKAAHRKAKSIRGSRPLSPFRCKYHDGLWHIGGTPLATLLGQKTRDEVYGRVDDVA
jgi:hypothetical protein